MKKIECKMDKPKLIPARKLGIGYFIQEQMEIRCLEKRDLACQLEISVNDFEKLLNSNIPISIDIAKALSIVFETSYQYWLNLGSKFSEINAKTVD